MENYNKLFKLLHLKLLSIAIMVEPHYSAQRLNLDGKVLSISKC